MIAAARLPLRSDPAKSQFEHPSSHGLIVFSQALLSMRKCDRVRLTISYCAQQIQTQTCTCGGYTSFDTLPFPIGLKCTEKLESLNSRVSTGHFGSEAVSRDRRFALSGRPFCPSPLG